MGKRSENKRNRQERRLREARQREQEDMERLPPMPPNALEDLRSSFYWLDYEVRIGYLPCEIECQAEHCAHLASVIFFGWLTNHGFGNGADVLAQMVRHFVEDVYLSDDSPKRKRVTLSNITKPRIGEFLNLVEFAVPDDLWNRHLNPFEGLRLFYQFLEEVGYPAAYPRRGRALQDLKRSMNKRPCSPPQAGYEAVQ